MKSISSFVALLAAIFVIFASSQVQAGTIIGPTTVSVNEDNGTEYQLVSKDYQWHFTRPYVSHEGTYPSVGRPGEYAWVNYRSEGCFRWECLAGIPLYRDKASDLPVQEISCKNLIWQRSEKVQVEKFYYQKDVPTPYEEQIPVTETVPQPETVNVSASSCQPQCNMTMTIDQGQSAGIHYDFRRGETVLDTIAKFVYPIGQALHRPDRINVTAQGGTGAGYGAAAASSSSSSSAAGASSSTSPGSAAGASNGSSNGSSGSAGAGGGPSDSNSGG